MSKLQFFEMRAEQMATMYEPTFTKKDAIATGKKLIADVVESGNVGKVELMSQIVRLKAVIDTAESELRSILPHEKISINGVEFNPVDGGNTLNYSEDEVYNALKQDLDNRVELLKLAQKQEVIDAYGNVVPKVGTTPRKSSITVKF